MSNKKIVSINETVLVNMIDDIVQEAVAIKLADEKKKWIAENKIEANAVLLERIEKLQKTVNEFLKG